MADIHPTSQAQQHSHQVHDAAQLEFIFDGAFYQQYNTRLLGGADEPLYQPADKDCSHHTIFYRQDFFSSALHEISHWCIAGEKRRQLVDFGYWYEADGRNIQQQKEFLNVEVKPQALESLFSSAAQIKFSASLDNVNSEESCAQQSAEFELAVTQQAEHYINKGLPPRAQTFYQALQNFYSDQSSENKNVIKAKLKVGAKLANG